MLPNAGGPVKVGLCRHSAPYNSSPTRGKGGGYRGGRDGDTYLFDFFFFHSFFFNCYIHLIAITLSSKKAKKSKKELIRHYNKKFKLRLKRPKKASKYT